MSNDNVTIWGHTNRVRPSVTQDGTIGQIRAGRFGDMYTQPISGSRMHALADEGSYFVATNATVGTGIAGITAADGFDDLEALIHLRNSGTASESKRIYLDFIELQPTAAGTNGTNFSLAMKLDTGATRRSSGGTAITPVNPNMDSSASTIATMYFGAVVTAAATSSARLLGETLVRSAIKVIGDRYLIVFGDSTKSNSSMIVAGTAIANITIQAPPVVLGPTDQFLLHEYAASQTVAASYTFRMGWWER